MIAFLLVGAGGALGAAGRYGVSLLLARPGDAFPWATLAVNVAGCLAIGALLPGGKGLPLGDSARLFLVTGLLGGFTTFSAFGHETLSLLRRGAGGAALLYAAASLLLGIGAVWAGRLLSAAWDR